MDELTRYYRESLLADLCDEYKGYWQSAKNDKEKLIRLSLSQQAIPHVASFAYMGKGLSKEFFLREFSDYINGYTVHDADDVKGFTYGLYVDYNDVLDIDKDVTHIMWSVGTNVVVPLTKAPIIYVTNKSDVHLICEGYNNVKVYLFDESRLTIDDLGEDGDVVVYKYSTSCDVVKGKYCLGSVKEFAKELRL